MSKSDPSELSRINLNDSSDQIFNKIKKAKTDTQTTFLIMKMNYLSRPEAENLLGIYSSLSDQSLKNTLMNFLEKIFQNLKIN